MIAVSKEQLDTVQYLIQQSTQGNHILFDLDLVRHVFTSSSKPMGEEEAYQVEHHIERLIAMDGFAKQKAYIEELAEETLHRVIKTYFNIVENSLFESSQVRH
ncbi:MAG: hypothetical protein H7333_02495 [Bdellovibrionales bacterium]|nr:hypothetical protein [Oligoflexia bacterium]